MSSRYHRRRVFVRNDITMSQIPLLMKRRSWQGVVLVGQRTQHQKIRHRMSLQVDRMSGQLVRLSLRMRQKRGRRRMICSEPLHRTENRRGMKLTPVISQSSKYLMIAWNQQVLGNLHQLLGIVSQPLSTLRRCARRRSGRDKAATFHFHRLHPRRGSESGMTIPAWRMRRGAQIRQSCSRWACVKKS